MYVPHSYPKFNYVSPHVQSFDEVLSLFVRQIHTKYVDFEFKEEYRLTKYLFESSYWKDINLADRKFKVPKDCFKSVIFGHEMLPSEICEIIELCKRESLKVDFFIATPITTGSVNLDRYIL